MTPSPPPVDETEQQDSQPEEFDMPEFSYELKIPRDRIAVLIGPKGKMKRELEEQTKLLYEKLEIGEQIQEDYRMVDNQPDYLYN